ncbi:protein GRIP isoform X1 [Canna indica]|uniref:Protein GRIP isoform X1 n=1 Tax=Canna indica TaxID=4628 RepID=A0AAQ3KKN1_9LILI|nr:protein GRIP isoform X1 [Canna indica]
MATGEDEPILNKEEIADDTLRQSLKENGSANMLEQPVETDRKVDDCNENAKMENGIHHNLASHDENIDELRQMVLELSFQNEYLKSQLNDLKSEILRPIPNSENESQSSQHIGSSEQDSSLHEHVKYLQKEIQEQKETQKAAEDALEHLRMTHSEADGKVQELSAKLIEAQQKMEQEIRERDEKYVELDTKFGRLHKRAKQRIQELQKEKDDLEARFNDVNMKVEQAASQQALAQQELERSRQQANEALRSMDVERQQLRAANSKLRDNLDEMRRSLEAKDSALEALHQSTFEKEQLLEQVRGALQASEEKRQVSFTELSAKYQKQVESLEAQLTDALAESSKAAETISSLQSLVAEKDTKIAELDAASTGEAVRLGVALEEMRGELNHLKDQQDKEKQNWEAACQALRTKLEASENNCLRSEIELAKLRSQLELESSTKYQMLSAKEAELIAVKDEIKRLENEFSSYKVRAHALLLKKDAELAEAKNSEQLKSLEQAVKEAETELATALAERDKAVQALEVALKEHDKEITERDAALCDAERQIRSITMKLESTNSRYMSEKEMWQKNLESIEESWRLKYGTLEAQKVEHSEDLMQKELDDLKRRYEKLREEHDVFRDIADRAIEDKEKEMAKLIEDNKKLRGSLESNLHVSHSGKQNSALASQKQDLSIGAADQQILLLARQQAQREEELAQSQRHILALQEEIEELERENRLHSQQEAMLKEELRNMERSHKREGIDMTYLKNVILKLLETGEVEALLPVVATLLQFSPDEVRKCQQAYRSSGDAITSPAGPYSETPTQSSLFSRFSF